MKKYLNFKDGEIENSETADYIDDLEINEELLNIVEEEKNEIKENIVEEILEVHPKEPEINKEFIGIMNPGHKTYLYGNYNYKDDEEKLKKPKKKEKKPRNFFNIIFGFLLFWSRVLFCVCLILFAVVITLYLQKREDVPRVEITEEVIINSVVEEVIINKDVETLTEYKSFKNAVNDYINNLTKVINGELLIIDNLKKGIINEKEAYSYFKKTMEKKQAMLSDLNDISVPSDLNKVMEYLKQMTIRAENNSKSIMNRYLLGESSTYMISDMSGYYDIYLDEIETLNSYLGKI